MAIGVQEVLYKFGWSAEPQRCVIEIGGCSICYEI